MSKSEKVNMGKFIEEYFRKSQNIKLIILLLDIRHTPTEDDIEMYKYILQENFPFIIVANKADKIAITKVENAIQDLKDFLGISFTTLLPFSSERKIYTNDILNKIEEFLKA